MTTSVLECIDVWYAYQPSKFVLRGVSLELEEGKVYMIFGRSGAGKTTLLKVLKGILRPTSGIIRYRSKDLLSDEDRRVAYRSIGYVPQGFGVVSNLSVLENVLTGALSRVSTLHSILGQFPEEEVERALRVIETVGLKDFAHNKVSSLSGGQKQRVAIARTLMQDPEVILADEFVSQLDPLTSRDVLEVFREICKGEKKITLVITTHDADIAYEYADSLVVMREGGITFRGSPGTTKGMDLLSAMR
ncbi:MAG: ATP-binding cassette domain-containing protein [Aigarchaeota archaeon]|nr:ATP-binding cassette domain-containing protein [Aigarchaeota archaeon]MDW8093221.1 ATP-binding cassette domain-containing protein [Nitrososphaerota archaeon]